MLLDPLAAFPRLGTTDVAVSLLIVFVRPERCLSLVIPEVLHREGCNPIVRTSQCPFRRQGLGCTSELLECVAQDDRHVLGAVILVLR